MANDFKNKSGLHCRNCGVWFEKKHFPHYRRTRSPDKWRYTCEFCKRRWQLDEKLKMLDLTEDQHKESLAQVNTESREAENRGFELRAREVERVEKTREARAQVTQESDTSLSVTVDHPYRPHKKQELFHNSSARFRTVVAGVRGGKSKAAALELLDDAMSTEKGYFWCVAPWFGIAEISEMTFQELLEPFEGLYEYNRKHHRYILPSKSIVEFRSAENYNALRGPGLDGIWIDEGGYLKKEAIYVLRTRVSTPRVPGGRLGKIWTSSTPKGKNWMYGWFLKGHSDSEDDRDFASFHWESRENPQFPEEEWDAAMKELPQDVFDQEYRAVFLDSAAGVFRNIEGCVKRHEQECPPKLAEQPLIMGVDLAKSKDFTVVWVMDGQGRHLDFLRMNDLSWVTQKEEIVRMYQKWNADVWLDATGLGDPIYDDLKPIIQNKLHAVKLSQLSKTHIIQSLQVAMEQTQVTIPDDDLIKDEIRWYEYSKTLTGGFKYNAPPGGHDDVVIALALANWGRNQTGAMGAPVIIDAKPVPIRENSGMISSGRSIGQTRRRSPLLDSIRRIRHGMVPKDPREFEQRNW